MASDFNQTSQVLTEVGYIGGTVIILLNIITLYQVNYQYNTH